ncbi:hypothetical protein [Spirosoma pollinicola]|uniref:Uncharacterized protein n=1 Tax=Spirosoma pollinicola TaxID=2057025 RepID=A0A2K8ZAM7_9BACT|nr:hypothetical protein [Spirosoma pollinicola]AUD06928.1 hypothetical protein CWM47_36870 [Spirosoma pollinicola]
MRICALKKREFEHSLEYLAGRPEDGHGLGYPVVNAGFDHVRFATGNLKVVFTLKVGLNQRPVLSNFRRYGGYPFPSDLRRAACRAVLLLGGKLSFGERQPNAAGKQGNIGRGKFLAGNKAARLNGNGFVTVIPAVF